MTARTMILAAGLLAGFATPAWSHGDDIPVRGNWLWRAGWHHFPAIMPSCNASPWFLYWPADANETLASHNFQTSPYPTWQAPHAAYPSYPTQRPVGQFAQRPYAQPIQQVPAQSVYYPVSYYPASYPPYSYGR